MMRASASGQSQRRNTERQRHRRANQRRRKTTSSRAVPVPRVPVGRDADRSRADAKRYLAALSRRTTFDSGRVVSGACELAGDVRLDGRQPACLPPELRGFTPPPTAAEWVCKKALVEASYAEEAVESHGSFHRRGADGADIDLAHLSEVPEGAGLVGLGERADLAQRYLVAGDPHRGA